ncbi:DNA-binding transcriptional regulator, LysR family [Pseudomonas citronellolis]|uniref:DNA-binding transcriptional regulator, LysR family n=1 Tax=Pseudomonas citronellolis TaxID=53408 RepID=A0AAQ1QZ43_9PSED|nr:LysR substrate-binding domain-containing protein [Pseudomonas citronellolis]TGC26402.1 hypothetical protein CW310_18995 [Pseudomonas citronellolis]SFD56935.1 DNA-binding transcriptional regulator, LysR family [Pseudomonas citronellolis]
MKEGSIGRNLTLQDDSDWPGLLLELHWFARLVEARGFSAAARVSGLSKSSMSRRLQQLERRMGVQLVQRSNRVFALTSIGEGVYRHAQEMLAAAEAATHSAQAALKSASGFVRLAAPGILQGWLVRLLAKFLAQQPRIHIGLFDLGPEHDPIAQMTDISLSLAVPPHDSTMLAARNLATLRTHYMAAPAMAGNIGHGQAATASSLPLLCDAASGTSKGATFSTDSLLALREAAIAGLGVVCLPAIACSEELRAGSLRIIQTAEAPPEMTLLAITPPTKAITQASRILMNEIQDAARSSYAVEY